jgi:1-acyl-sn-glycerol-3-phosphate acyltransferase
MTLLPPNATELPSTKKLVSSATSATGPLAPSELYRYIYPWARWKMASLARVLAPRLQVTGTIHIPRRGGVILAPNHISDADPLYVGLMAPRPLWFMAKSELFEMGLLGPIMRFLQAFPVQPDAADRSSLKRAEELLKARQAVTIFPEGRIIQKGENSEILQGAIMVALRAGVPVIPVGLAGFEHIVPYGSVIPRPTLAPVHIHYGKPLHFDGLVDLPRREARRIATLRLQEGMQQAVRIAGGELKFGD